MERLLHSVFSANSAAENPVDLEAVSDRALWRLCEIFRAGVVDINKRSVVVEVTGGCDKIDALEGLLRPFGLIEMARTGEIAISRGRSET